MRTKAPLRDNRKIKISIYRAKWEEVPAAVCRMTGLTVLFYMSVLINHWSKIHFVTFFL